MPELPEVEVICRGLAPHLLGQRLQQLWYSGKPLRQPVPAAELQALHALPIISVKRRAKYILIEVESHARILFHLGMTGNLGLFPEQTPRRPHDHLEWHLNAKLLLRFHDPRRFGAVSVISDPSPDAVKNFFQTSGPEPLSSDFTADYLEKTAKSRSIAIKPFLMTNQIVVGIGNIYANEILFEARIRPERSVQTLHRTEWQQLVTATRKILNHAIDCGGSTISDFRNASQESGYFQMSFQVYGKTGQPCGKCGAPLNKITLGGRASFFCSHCQR